jgi:hypothetical protein
MPRALAHKAGQECRGVPMPVVSGRPCLRLPKRGDSARGTPAQRPLSQPLVVGLTSYKFARREGPSSKTSLRVLRCVGHPNRWGRWWPKRYQSFSWSPGAARTITTFPKMFAGEQEGTSPSFHLTLLALHFTQKGLQPLACC